MSTPDVTPSDVPAANRFGAAKQNRSLERIIEWALLCCAGLSILVTIAIALVVIFGAINFFTRNNGSPMDFQASLARLWEFFTTTTWSAGFDNPQYGIWSLLMGTLLVALIAAAIAMPVGLSTAIYLSEYAKPSVRAIAKPILELLAGIPTVVYGFLAISTITPLLALVIPGLNQPYNQLAGGIVVGIMIIPMVASLSEDALRSVPQALRDGAFALGATKAETSLKVVVPAALSGITASFILAISRAIGETMAVSLACGEMARFTLDPREGAMTMTGFIVHMSKGDVPYGTNDFNSLFAVACLLFFITLAMNIFAQKFLRRYRQVYR